LLALRGAGLLSALDLEVVIERALQSVDGRVALDDLHLLLAGTGLAEGEDAPTGIH
jgi:hypothetical protein